MKFWTFLIILGMACAIALSAPEALANICQPQQNCNNDGACSQGFCVNNVCHCNEVDPGFCTTGCIGFGYDNSQDPGDSKIDITSCRGARSYDMCNGASWRCFVQSYCFTKQPSCVANQNTSCTGTQKCNASCPGDNVCTTTGTVACNGSCVVSAPPNSACPAPTCVISQSLPVRPNQPVLAAASGGITPYAWGSSPSAGSITPQAPPTSAVFLYPAAGIYTAQVTGANGKTGLCTPTVSVCVANAGSGCSSSVNGCGMKEDGTVQCDGSCKNSTGQLVQTPSDNGCPAPSCTIVPGTALPLATVQGTGIGGLKPYTWSSTGINPTGAGDSYAHYYTTTGAKTVTVSGKNGASSTCKVTILAPYQTTGIHRTKQDTPRHIDYSTDYQVWAKVWDESGTESAWSPLRSASTVAGPWPTASFSWSPLQIFAGLPIQFQDKSSPQPSAWRWLFNDGTATTEVTGTGSPLYSFAREGNYTVTLEATNAAGTCSSLPAALKSGKGLPNYREVRPGSRPSPTPTSGATKP